MSHTAARFIATTALTALAVSGCQRRTLVPCTTPAPAALAAAPAPRSDSVTLRFDYAGAEALLEALGRDSLSDADVDSLLRVQGVRAMVDNVTYYIPELDRTDFRRAIQSFVRTRRTASDHGPFRLDRTWDRRAQIRALVDSTRRNERAVLARTLAGLAPYQPETGPLHVPAYLVAGGVSTGFVPPGEAAFYVNLTDASGDYEGLLWNIRHETYHRMQHAALRRVPKLAPIADAYDSLPVVERLLATVLMEGTAELVADPTCTTARGPEIDRARNRFLRNAAPRRLRQNFALFDELLRELRSGRMSWREAYDRGFANEARLYAVGYAMAREIERDCGAACIRRLFGQPPAEFFRQYVRLYRARPEIVGRFAPETERLLGMPP